MLTGDPRNYLAAHEDRVGELVAILEQALTSKVRPCDFQYIFAKDFSDRLVAVPAFHQADGEERLVAINLVKVNSLREQTSPRP